VLPSRVVDIGEREDSPIRLHINQNGTRGQYAALSYCWGGDQPYKTTNSNLNSYTHELASNIFPKTLSDAIKVCREVGIRYIWIDALCIVQDDQKDKAKQISHMGRIYKDATFTIMVASARSVYEGFLGNAKVDAPAAKLPFHIDEDSFGAVFVRSCYNSPYFLDKEPIFNRAWTLQEMLLPSRILMFDSYQVTLKCGEYDFLPAMDTYLDLELPINSKASPEYGILQNFHLERLAKEYDGNAFLTKEDIDGFTARGYSRQSQIWTSLMAEYSRRDISVINDRYPALAGVTEELQKIWDGEYAAGFWKGSLVQHLGWVGGVNNEEFGGRKWKSRLEGPSWSWMSHPSSISIDPVAVTDVKVLGCVTELASIDQPFGKVKKGILVLEARTLPLSDLRAQLRPNLNSGWKRTLAIMPEAVAGIALDFPEQGMPGGELKALVLGLTYSSVGEHCLSLLVLHKLERGTYERIGHAIMHTAEGDRSERIGHAVFHTAETLQPTKEILAKAKREVVIIE
jgi:Heterokaryon incompatibility protein (HET)